MFQLFVFPCSHLQAVT